MVVYTSTENRAAQDRARAGAKDRLITDVDALQDVVAESRATMETFGIAHAVQANDWGLTQGNSDRLRIVHPTFEAIAVADSSGIIRASSPRATGSADISREEFFRRAVATKGLVVSGYQTDRLTGRPAIIISMPIYDAAIKHLVAVEYIAVAPERFGGKLANADPFITEILVDGAGAVVSRRPAADSLIGKAYPEAELNRAIWATGHGEATVAGIDGVIRQYYFAPVFPNREGGLHLAIGFSPDQLLASARLRYASTLGAAGVIAIFALIAAWMVGTYTVYRPALLLKEAAERFAKGDFKARALLGDRTDEFGALRDEFNNMAESLEAHVAELESARHELHLLNTELEERVRRRTAELEASVQELDAFSYSVSHDLRSPLRAIDGFSLALQEDYSNALDEGGRDDLRRVRHAAGRMGHLIDGLLRLSRLSRQEMRRSDVDLSGIAREVAESLQEIEPDRQVAFQIAPGVRGKGDPELLRVVLENLIGNAWKFTSKRDAATIEFGAIEANDQVTYFVRDNGAGFDMAYASKLFGAFQRLHGQEEFPGTGIGLATAARIVRRHGGRIWAAGEPDRGATFSFALSRDDAAVANIERRQMTGPTDGATR
jgi:signal transduction histidine kinase